MTSLREDELELELEGEEEFEFEGEADGEYEDEALLGTIGNIARGIFGQGEEEWELEAEYEGELEGEEFFRRIGALIRRAAPVLRRVARVAAPIVGTAVGGPLGGILGRAASSLLREGELEFELEGELELEMEGEYEDEAPAPTTQTEGLAELMAAVASQARTEAEAEAMVGAATVTTISAADRAALRQVLPHMVRGTAVLTRILRRRPATRIGVRAVPAIVRGTATTLARRAAAGQPVTRRTAARVMAGQTRRVLANPRVCARAIQRNVRATRAVARPGMVRRPTVVG
jgi:hypothetical protein